MPGTQPVVEDLKALLSSRPDLKDALEAAIKAADLPHCFTDLDSYCRYLDRGVQQIPKNEDSMLQLDLAYYYVLQMSPNQVLMTDPAFQQWNLGYHDAWGKFLDTDASIGHLKSYLDDPQFEKDQFQQGPSGWHTFNQFFARQFKPGMRPIAGNSADNVVTSPCDYQIMEVIPVNPDSTVGAKEARLTIAELLKDSQYKDDFAGGLLVSGYLQMYNYHRFHTPVAGKVVEVRKIPGHVGMTFKKEDGALVPDPRPGFQFTQDRGLMIVDSPALGLVALLPVGMAQISSVVITAETGVTLHQGEEFGYFQFGGSNMIMLTQKGRFELSADVQGKALQMGSRIGTAAVPAGTT